MGVMRSVRAYRAVGLRAGEPERAPADGGDEDIVGFEVPGAAVAEAIVWSEGRRGFLPRVLARASRGRLRVFSCPTEAALRAALAGLEGGANPLALLVTEGSVVRGRDVPAVLQAELHRGRVAGGLDLSAALRVRWGAPRGEDIRGEVRLSYPTSGEALARSVSDALARHVTDLAVEGRAAPRARAVLRGLAESLADPLDPAEPVVEEAPAWSVHTPGRAAAHALLFGDSRARRRARRLHREADARLRVWVASTRAELDGLLAHLGRASMPIVLGLDVDVGPERAPLAEAFARLPLDYAPGALSHRLAALGRLDAARGPRIPERMVHRFLPRASDIEIVDWLGRMLTLRARWAATTVARSTKNVLGGPLAWGPRRRVQDSVEAMRRLGAHLDPGPGW